ncbi:MAG TPA: DNA topoisomerase IB [Solirubrobacterales bacterium]|jgi:DNA topoisomerase IB|nr:DNA topoisomerase IB [Solirubrobacterales bacterium]
MKRLRRADCSAAGIHRRRRGGGFSFEDAQGTTITDEETLERIRALAIPPAWKDVWICLDPVGHIQATGRDEAGRKQYRYHDRWDQRRASRKYASMREFAAALPRLRRVVRRDIEVEGMPRERALATAVRLLDLGFFRIGGEEYAETNESYGLATIRREHVHRDGEEIVFDFPAKSNQRRIQAIGDEAAIAALEAMRRRRGGPADLLAWKEGRRWRDLRSSDINDYIHEAIGEEFSAKDFRTWSGTVLAAAALAGEEKPASDAAAKRTINRAVKTVAAALGNTPAVCRRSYIDPRVLDRYRDGETIEVGRRAASAGRMSERTRQKIERQVLDLIG